MPGTAGARFGTQAFVGTDHIDDIDTINQAQLALLEAKGARVDIGTLSAHPTSSGGTPGITGRFYYATDTQQLFYDTGAGWLTIREQDSGWVALTLPTGWGTYAGTDPAAARLVGDTVRLRGTAQNNTGGGAGLNITIPTAFRPSVLRIGPYIGSVNIWQFTTVSNLNFGTALPANFIMGLEGISYPL